MSVSVITHCGSAKKGGESESATMKCRASGLRQDGRFSIPNMRSDNAQYMKKIKLTGSMNVCGTLVGLFMASFASVAQAPLDIRVALVIGNATYKNVPPLANSVNDARAMTLVLRKLGFKVIDVIDGDRTSMTQAIGRMQADLKGQQAVAMLYYAGHGLQLDWRNYMVPVDANIDKAEDVPKQTVDIEQVIKSFKDANTRMNIIVLDACRDNPFAGSASAKGLAQLDAPPGTYLAFATAPGNVAEDGDETTGNGLFTQFLLKELQRPAKIEEVFKRVRLQVRQKSQGRQIPWDSSSLEDEFSFNDGEKFKFTAEDYQREVAEAKARQERLKREAEAALEREKQLAQLREQERLKRVEAQRIAEQKSRERAEEEARQREQQLALAAEAERKKALAAQEALARSQAEETKRLKDLELARIQAEQEAQRKKLSAEVAREQQFAQEKADWDRIKDSKNPEDFYAFLLKYPTGFISEQATFAIEYLQKSKTTPQKDRNGLVQQTGKARLNVGDEFHFRVSTQGVAEPRVSKTVISAVRDNYVFVDGNLTTPYRTIDGGVIRIKSPRGDVTFDPPRTDLPGGEFVIGKQWTSRTVMTLPDGRQIQVEASTKVVGFEEITVPAGKFNAFKLEMTQRMADGRLFNSVSYWVDPNWGLSLRVARVFYLRPDGSPGNYKELQELVYAKYGGS